MVFKSIIFLFSFLTVSAFANGNCDGKPQCYNMYVKNVRLTTLRNAIDKGIDKTDNAYYGFNPIACTGPNNTQDGICAYLQGGGGFGFSINGADLTALLNHMYSDTGCLVCGNVPSDWDNNDYEGPDGGLTVNYVANRQGCNGLCDQNAWQGGRLGQWPTPAFDGST